MIDQTDDFLVKLKQLYLYIHYYDSTVNVGAHCQLDLKMNLMTIH